MLSSQGTTRERKQADKLQPMMFTLNMKDLGIWTALALKKKIIRKSA